MNCHTQIWAESPILEPCAREFSDRKIAGVDARAQLPGSSISITAFMSTKAWGHHLHRTSRSDAAHVAREHPIYGVVFGVSSQSGAVLFGPGQCLQHGLAATSDQIVLGKKLVQQYRSRGSRAARFVTDEEWNDGTMECWNSGACLSHTPPRHHSNRLEFGVIVNPTLDTRHSTLLDSISFPSASVWHRLKVRLLAVALKNWRQQRVS